MASRRIHGFLEPAMSKRFSVKQRKGFTLGRRVYEIVDAQTKRDIFSSFVKSDCLKRAAKLNKAEAACAGGFNARRK